MVESKLPHAWLSWAPYVISLVASSMWYHRCFYRLHLFQNALSHLSFRSFFSVSYILHLKSAVLPIKALDRGVNPGSRVAHVAVEATVRTISTHLKKQTTPPRVGIFKIIVSYVVFILDRGSKCVTESIIGCVAATLCSKPS